MSDIVFKPKTTNLTLSSGNAPNTVLIVRPIDAQTSSIRLITKAPPRTNLNMLAGSVRATLINFRTTGGGSGDTYITNPVVDPEPPETITLGYDGEFLTTVAGATEDKTLTYDGDGRLERVVDAKRSITRDLTYDNDGKLTEVAVS